MSTLRYSWNRAWQSLGILGDGAGIYADLVARYSEPHRHYHTTQHLTECLKFFSETAALAEKPAEVEFAIWFHDAIYDVKQSDNEEQSAILAKSVLAEHGVDSEAAQYVHDLILVTRHSALPVTQDEKLLVDIDLSILGADEVRFSEYEQQIREEYAFIPDELFVKKRRAILQSFLDRLNIYSMDYFISRLEEKARNNLRRAVSRQQA